MKTIKGITPLEYPIETPKKASKLIQIEWGGETSQKVWHK